MKQMMNAEPSFWLAIGLDGEANAPIRLSIQIVVVLISLWIGACALLCGLRSAQIAILRTSHLVQSIILAVARMVIVICHGCWYFFAILLLCPRRRRRSFFDSAQL